MKNVASLMFIQCSYIHTHFYRFLSSSIFGMRSKHSFLARAMSWSSFWLPEGENRSSDFSKKYSLKCPPAQTTNLMRWSNIDKAIRLWFAKTLTFWHSPSARENNFKMRVEKYEFSIQEQTVVKSAAWQRRDGRIEKIHWKVFWLN